jgi:hypothetical protein
LAYAIVMVIVVLLLQFFTPFPVLRWITGWPMAKAP